MITRTIKQTLSYEQETWDALAQWLGLSGEEPTQDLVSSYMATKLGQMLDEQTVEFQKRVIAQQTNSTVQAALADARSKRTIEVVDENPE